MSPLLFSCSSPKPQAPSLFFLVAFCLGAAPAHGDEEGARQVVFWIRAGALSEREAEGDPEETPRLRELVLDGVTAAEVVLPDPISFEPKAIAALLFDEPSRRLILERRGAPLAEVGPQKEDRSPGAPGSSWNHPVVALLEKRFGRPPPPSEDEEASVQRIRAFLARGAAAAGTAGSPAEPGVAGPANSAEDRGEALKPDPGALDVAHRAISALADGAPLVIALEPVSDRARAKARDAALGWLAAALRGRDAFLVVLSARGGDAASGKGAGPPPRTFLTVSGPDVRRGMVIGERKPLAAVSATVFRLLGIPPPDRQQLEQLDVLNR
jgi:hypothetical protein